MNRFIATVRAVDANSVTLLVDTVELHVPAQLLPPGVRAGDQVEIASAVVDGEAPLGKLYAKDILNSILTDTAS